MAGYDWYSSDESADELHPLAESLLSKKKREIVDKSMAVFAHNLNKWLDNTTLSVPAGKPRGKRVRDDQDSNSEGNDASCGEGSPRGASARGQQKRTKRETATRKFACPYYKHNPERYKNAKTCMGPGWTTVHRVKYVILYYPKRVDDMTSG